MNGLVISEGSDILFNEEIKLVDYAGKKFKRFFWICILVLIPIIIVGLATKGLGEKPGIKPLSSFKAGNNSFQLARVDRDLKNNRATFQFYVTENSIDPLVLLHGYVSSSRGGNVRKMKTKMIKVNDSYYVLQVENVKKKYKSAYIALETKKEKKSFSSVSATNIDLTSVPKKNNKVRKTKAEYTNDYFKFIVAAIDKKIDQKVKVIEKSNGNIKTLKQNLAVQNKTLKVKEGSDIKETKDRISETKDSISNQKKIIKKANKKIKSLQKDKEKYQQRNQ